jgi:predicted metal-dependent HD superfamily phosphohydrolase
VSDAAAVRALSWRALWRRLGGTGEATVPLAEIERRYAEPGRHYHTLAHLDACLDTFELVRSLCVRPDEAELALWLHDLIWTPLGTDNEEQSAAWAEARCRAAGLPAELGARVAALILATRHDGATLSGDAAVVADVDLAILGASYEAFDRYEAAIRAEYASVPDATFRAGRARIVRAFLARPAIYATQPLHDALELRARENLVRSLVRLGPAIHPGPF